jgi:hypothetical protein
MAAVLPRTIGGAEPTDYCSRAFLSVRFRSRVLLVFPVRVTTSLFFWTISHSTISPFLKSSAFARALGKLTYQWWIDQVHDPRIEKKTTYPLSMMVWEAILLYVLKLGSRRQIKWLLRKNPAAVLSHLAQLTKRDLSNLTTIAGDDAIKDLFAQLAVQHVQNIVHQMIRHLLQQRKLEHSRLLDEYYMIAFDATGLFHRHSPHCPHCLVSKSKSGEILYSHSVLEAKLIHRSLGYPGTPRATFPDPAEPQHDLKQRRRDPDFFLRPSTLKIAHVNNAWIFGVSHCIVSTTHSRPSPTLPPC